LSIRKLQLFFGAIVLVAAALSTAFVRGDVPDAAGGFAASLVAFTRSLPDQDAVGCAECAAAASARAYPDAPDAWRDVEYAAQAAILRDIVGNPFRPASPPQSTKSGRCPKASSIGAALRFWPMRSKRRDAQRKRFSRIADRAATMCVAAGLST
jgi:hypothetical protein